jgi:hypothetical protein
VPLTEHVALVSLTDEIATRDLMRVSAAVQTQLTRDFVPFWGLPATIDAFADLLSIPSDYWPVVIFGDVEELAGRLGSAIGEERAMTLLAGFDANRFQGLHLNAYTRQPFALVQVSESWPVTVSHEALEILSNPSGNAMRAAAHPLTTDVRVNYLLEICDPCMPAWYLVNGIPVSDFCTPRFFDPVRFGPGRYSFTGEIAYPMEILDGGYVSWIDPRDSTLYMLAGGSREPMRLFGIEDLARGSTPLRTLVDTDPRTPRLSQEELHEAGTSISGLGGFEGVLDASRSTAVAIAQSLVSLASEGD